MSTVADRIKAAIAYRQVTEESVWRGAGIAYTTWQDIIKDRTERPRKSAEIARELRVRHEWLLFGLGPMLPDGIESNVDEGPEINGHVRWAPVTGRVRGGADPVYIEEEGYPVGDSDTDIPYRGKDENTFGLRVVGDSMAPRYNHGEYIAARPNMTVSVGDYIYAALTDGRKLVKKLGRDMSDAYELHSVNDAHRPITVLKSDVACMYRITGPYSADEVRHK